MLELLAIFLLICIMISYVIGLRGKEHQPEPQPNNQAQPNTKQLKMNADNIEQTLQFMMSNNIITPDEYNELLRKSLPYVL